LEAQGKLQLRQSQLAELDAGDAPLLLVCFPVIVCCEVGQLF
jgi:hypothetical protein